MSGMFKASIFSCPHETTMDDLRELPDRSIRSVHGVDMQNDNDARATWAAQTLVAYTALVGDSGELETQIVDVLADLRHLCDALGLDYAAADETAATRHSEEIHGCRP